MEKEKRKGRRENNETSKKIIRKEEQGDAKAESYEEE
jgi:hypothetical protein